MIVTPGLVQRYDSKHVRSAPDFAVPIQVRDPLPCFCVSVHSKRLAHVVCESVHGACLSYGELASRAEAALLGSDNRESVAGLYRLPSRMRGPRLVPVPEGSDEAARRGRTEVGLVWEPGNNAGKGKKRTK